MMSTAGGGRPARMVGQTISHYRVLGQIGAGGMGVVYRGEDLRLGRAVALKFVSEDLAHDQHAVQRLRAEARAASALNHGNICTIYDIDEHEGHPFIVMELLKGRTLRDSLADGPLKIHHLVDFGIQIADALHAAHSEGIIHRDIKPGNLFVTERGQVKILDFGLAKLKPLFDATGTTRDVGERTSRGVTLGTTGYMSPEQATGEELDTRTDLFSLGVVLYECATGRHPFPGKSSAVVLSAILNRSPTPPSALNPDLPVRVQEVINNCLEKDRELRYQSAADLRADLKRVRRDIESGHSEAIEPVRSGASKTSRSASGAEAAATTAPGASRWQAAAAIAAIALVVGAGAYVVWQREQAPPLERQRIDPAPDSSTPVLALATASLDARNYRAAVSYAEQVLAVRPDHAGAIKIRDAARAALQRFDAAIADARKRLAAKDVRGATQALDAARGIDAASPAVIEIGSLIADQTRPREPAVRATQSTRTLEDASRTVDRAPSTPATGKPQGAPVSDTPPQPDPKVDVPPPSVPPGPLPAPPVTATPPAAAQQPPAPVQQAPKASPTTPAHTADTPQRSASPAGPSKEEEDHAAIRRLVATFTRAIENKDVALYRSIRPNLSPEEERRLQDGFRAVTSQRVELRITAIDLRGDEATVTLRRRDTIRAGGQQQVSEEREQRMMLARAAGAWRIVDIR